MRAKENEIRFPESADAAIYRGGDERKGWNFSSGIVSHTSEAPMDRASRFNPSDLCLLAK